MIKRFILSPSGFGFPDSFDTESFLFIFEQLLNEGVLSDYAERHYRAELENPNFISSVGLFFKTGDINSYLSAKMLDFHRRRVHDNSGDKFQANDEFRFISVELPEAGFSVKEEKSGTDWDELWTGIYEKENLLPKSSSISVKQEATSVAKATIRKSIYL